MEWVHLYYEHTDLPYQETQFYWSTESSEENNTHHRSYLCKNKFEMAHTSYRKCHNRLKDDYLRDFMVYYNVEDVDYKP